MDVKTSGCFTAKYAFDPNLPVRLIGEPTAMTGGITVEFTGVKDAAEALARKLQREIAEANLAICEKGGRCLPVDPGGPADSVLYEAPIDVTYTTANDPVTAMKAAGVAHVRVTELPAVCQDTAAACRQGASN